MISTAAGAASSFSPRWSRSSGVRASISADRARRTVRVPHRLPPRRIDPVQALRPANPDILVAHLYDLEGGLRGPELSPGEDAGEGRSGPSRRDRNRAIRGWNSRVGRPSDRRRRRKTPSCASSSGRACGRLTPAISPGEACCLKTRCRRLRARRFTVTSAFANNRGSHILGYLVPGEHNDVRPGHRLYNWVWYRVADERLLAEIMTDRNGHARGYAIPEGLLADKWIAHLHRDAENLLPLPFRQVVEATAQPFAQAIRDLASDHMVDGPCRHHRRRRRHPTAPHSGQHLQGGRERSCPGGRAAGLSRRYPRGARSMGAGPGRARQVPPPARIADWRLSSVPRAA